MSSAIDLHGVQDALPLEINGSLIISRADAVLASTTRDTLATRRPDVWTHVLTRDGVDSAGKLLRGLRAAAEPLRGQATPHPPYPLTILYYPPYPLHCQ
jgi:hypothetical protein